MRTTSNRPISDYHSGALQGCSLKVGLNSGVYESKSAFFSLPILFLGTLWEPSFSFSFSRSPFFRRQTLFFFLFFLFLFFHLLQPFSLAIFNFSRYKQRACGCECVGVCEGEFSHFFTLTSACTRHRVIAHGSNRKSSRPTEQWQEKEGIKKIKK